MAHACMEGGWGAHDDGEADVVARREEGEERDDVSNCTVPRSRSREVAMGTNAIMLNASGRHPGTKHR